MINECGELLNVQITPGNVDDRSPVRDMCRQLLGQLFGEKGYIFAELTADLRQHDLRLVHLPISEGTVAAETLLYDFVPQFLSETAVRDQRFMSPLHDHRRSVVHADSLPIFKQWSWGSKILIHVVEILLCVIAVSVLPRSKKCTVRDNRRRGELWNVRVVHATA